MTINYYMWFICLSTNENAVVAFTNVFLKPTFPKTDMMMVLLYWYKYWGAIANCSKNHTHNEFPTCQHHSVRPSYRWYLPFQQGCLHPNSQLSREVSSILSLVPENTHLTDSHNLSRDLAFLSTPVIITYHHYSNFSKLTSSTICHSLYRHWSEWAMWSAAR